MAQNQYCAVAAIAHGLIGLSQARTLLRGHVSTPEKGATKGSKSASEKTLLALRSLGLDSSLLHHRIRGMMGISCFLAGFGLTIV